ncbi:CLUMA_CG008308, isoform A [Clunio marinus]|uniref:CLUMA_CG008308, isoform A n=1 Tax=Clunio marinus TaxID=568069 RepID=A0A1J1I789_9DIPT|nr:CLUMA_CG008308, isoform A [Clunio marinus]
MERFASLSLKRRQKLLPFCHFEKDVLMAEKKIYSNSKVIQIEYRFASARYFYDYHPVKWRWIIRECE